MTARPWGGLNDVLVAAAVVAAVVMMIVPLPPAVLDVLLTMNIALTLVVLLTAMYLQEPLQFSIFPSLLLLLTLFRLSLNVSATRLILLHGYAGEVIHSFGEFVVGGNYVVGLVVFIILIIIQFVVVTNGAQRVAEVAARFTLDAMPGKQMSIDADFNAGLIDEATARQRRKTISREADFYGAMDGASKFVRGDAIAAVIIVLVNIIGGFIIGMAQHGLSLGDALATYTLLTVGEGLVTQIPALLVSTATGLVVTRSASERSLGQDVVAQLLSRPRALAVAAGILLVLVAVPGLPKVPFLVMGVAVALIARTVQQALDKSEAEKESEDARTPENVAALLELDALEVELAADLEPLVRLPDKKQNLLDQITSVRRTMAQELGLLVPPIRIRDLKSRKPGTYCFKIYGLEIAGGEIRFGSVLAMTGGNVRGPLAGGEPLREPVWGLPAWWITEDRAKEAEDLGYTVVGSSSQITTHLLEIIRAHAGELLGRQDVQNLINRIKQARPAVVEELTPAQLGVGEIQKVLQNLLRERISIRNLVVILETLSTSAKLTKDPEALSEFVRQALGRSICHQYQGAPGRLVVITLDPALEQYLLDALRRADKDPYGALSPRVVRAIYLSLLEKLEAADRQGHRPVVISSPPLRPYFRRIIEPKAPNVPVMSYGEVVAGYEIQSVGLVQVDLTQTQDLPPETRGAEAALAPG